MTSQRFWHRRHWRRSSRRERARRLPARRGGPLHQAGRPRSSLRSCSSGRYIPNAETSKWPLRRTCSAPSARFVRCPSPSRRARGGAHPRCDRTHGVGAGRRRAQPPERPDAGRLGAGAGASRLAESHTVSFSSCGALHRSARLGQIARSARADESKRRANEGTGWSATWACQHLSARAQSAASGGGRLRALELEPHDRARSARCSIWEISPRAERGTLLARLCSARPRPAERLKALLELAEDRRENGDMVGAEGALSRRLRSQPIRPCSNACERRSHRYADTCTRPCSSGGPGTRKRAPRRSDWLMGLGHIELELGATTRPSIISRRPCASESRDDARVALARALAARGPQARGPGAGFGHHGTSIAHADRRQSRAPPRDLLVGCGPCCRAVGRTSASCGRG